jgi:uncharacterized protein YegP (UPF0339 family)
MAAKFEIRSAKAGAYNWVLLSQGRTLASGESYSRRGAAEKAIESLRKAVASATVADLAVKAPTKKPAKAVTKGTTAATKATAKATTKRAGKTTATKTAAPRRRASRTG